MSPFRLFITRQKLSNALESLKSKKSLQESTDRASERVPLSASYLQLALAHVRNSRAEKGYSWHFEAILSEMPKKLGTSKYFYRLRGGGGVDFAGLRGF